MPLFPKHREFGFTSLQGLPVLLQVESPSAMALPRQRRFTKPRLLLESVPGLEIALDRVACHGCKGRSQASLADPDSDQGPTDWSRPREKNSLRKPY